MNKVLLGTLSFLGGCIVGGFVVKRYFDNKYEVITETFESEEEEEEPEMDDVKNDERPDRLQGEGECIISDEERKLYEELAETYDTLDIPEVPFQEDYEQPIYHDYPYPIPPEEFMTIDEYDSGDLTYYQDGYVTDSIGMPLTPEEIVNMLGDDFERHFGKFSDGELFMRNEKLNMDYSIAIDLDKFEDVAPARIKRMVGI